MSFRQSDRELARLARLARERGATVETQRDHIIVNGHTVRTFYDLQEALDSTTHRWGTR